MWKNPYSSTLKPHLRSSTMSKLLKIAAQRRLDVAAAKSTVSASSLEAKAAETRQNLGPPVNLFNHLQNHWSTTNRMAVAAEFKRASPSKGDIALGVDAADQALQYAEAGAIVVSVLTEPQWFKGSLEDMLAVRTALAGATTGGNRATLVLRKDFIVDRYQLLEACAYGADTVLLIVAILDKNDLKDLINEARSLGIEPLVEVANAVEMKTALEVGATVIGVNNRNLHTFKVDMDTTLRIVDVARESNAVVQGSIQNNKVLIVALSGIKTRADVVKYERYGGVAGILVGEALMRAVDPKAMIANLIGIGDVRQVARVKICGVTRAEDALVAAKAGADLIGVIFVQKSKRHATVDQAKDIVSSVRGFREKDGKVEFDPLYKGKSIEETKRRRLESSWFKDWAEVLAGSCDGQARPLVVGVFMDQPVEEVNRVAEETGIDMVQLHGSESLAYEAECALPVLRVVHVDADATSNSHVIKREDLSQGPAVCLLLDTSVKGVGSGGTGKTFDWAIAKNVKGEGSGEVPVVMAGGLTPENVAEAVRVGHPWGVDVASGVEASPGIKDHAKVTAFIKNAKSVAL